MDERLFEQLYQQYANDVLRMSYFYLADRQKAEDVTQDVFLKLYTGNPELVEGKEKAWLLQVTANQCRSLLRSAWWKRTAPLEDAPAEWEMPDRSVYRAVMSLKPKYRVVIFLHYYGGYTASEIGELLKLSPTAVTTRLSRGREQLRTLLKED